MRCGGRLKVIASIEEPESSNGFLRTGGNGARRRRRRLRSGASAAAGVAVLIRNRRGLVFLAPAAGGARRDHWRLSHNCRYTHPRRRRRVPVDRNRTSRGVAGGASMTRAQLTCSRARPAPLWPHHPRRRRAAPSSPAGDRGVDRLKLGAPSGTPPPFDSECHEPDLPGSFAGQRPQRAAGSTVRGHYNHLCALRTLICASRMNYRVL